jgi:hypothetical protein
MRLASGVGVFMASIIRRPSGFAAELALADDPRTRSVAGGRSGMLRP